jgi:hypothetical protein
MPKIASVPSATSVFPTLMALAAISLALLGPQKCAVGADRADANSKPSLSGIGSGSHASDNKGPAAAAAAESGFA